MVTKGRQEIYDKMKNAPSLFYIESVDAKKLNRFFMKSDIHFSDFKTLGELIFMFDQWILEQE